MEGGSQYAEFLLQAVVWCSVLYKVIAVYCHYNTTYCLCNNGRVGSLWVHRFFNAHSFYSFAHILWRDVSCLFAAPDSEGEKKQIYSQMHRHWVGAQICLTAKIRLGQSSPATSPYGKSRDILIEKPAVGIRSHVWDRAHLLTLTENMWRRWKGKGSPN